MDTTIFDHEKLHAYREALRFVAWVGPVIDELPKRLAARDQLDRASTSAVLNIAEGNGKRSGPDRCRFLEISRGSALECAACLDVLVHRGVLDLVRANTGKEVLVGAVSLISGLIARFSGRTAEDSGVYDEMTFKEYRIEEENE